MQGYLHQPLEAHEWGFLILLIVLSAGTVGGLVVGGIAVVTGYFRDRQRDEMDATLKMEMIQRGMSADEISTVLSATSAQFDPPPWATGCDPHQYREARRAKREAMRAARSSHHPA
jgi:hypothetical protein